MTERIHESNIGNILEKALEIPVMNREVDTAAMFYDLDFLGKKLEELKNEFPGNALHAIAAKANPLVKILKIINDSGNGLEVASLPELHLALKTGFPSDKIVFDSPAKTIKEIEFALEKGVCLNADSFRELDRIRTALDKIKTSSKIGIRINPQTGTGSIESTSVSGKISKFGIPLDNNREKLIEYILKNEWISIIHLHIGSQGFPINMLVTGVEKVFRFIQEVNAECIKKGLDRRIETFDIGGGLAVPYFKDSKAESMKEYRQKLESIIPELFNNDFKIITEFGRYIHANTAWVASRIEYVKQETDHNIIMTHLGADFFLRKCYNPSDWHHEISIADSRGRIKSDQETKKYIVAGPLCFAGDIIAKDIELPEAREGDYLIIHDVGAYNLSMWSRYNSRQIPLILGYSEKNNEFSILKKREKPEDLYSFWK